MDELTERVTELVMQRLSQKPRALLIGTRPSAALAYTLVEEAPYEALVIGSLSVHELLFPPDVILDALLQGLPVLLNREGIPHARKGTASKNLLFRLREAEQTLYRWGVQPLCTPQSGTFITAVQARQLRALGQAAPPDSRLTPLAREILEGTD